MSLRTILVAITIVMSCSSPRPESTSEAKPTEINKKETVPLDKDFDNFVAMLPEIALPLHIRCEDCCHHPEFEREHPLVKKYIPEGANTIGLFFKNEKHVGVLATYAADLLIPSVVIYDRRGKILSQRNFMTSYCGRDYDFVGLQHLVVNADNTLNAIDTTYTLKLDSLTAEIIDTLETEVVRKDFFIHASGEIVEIKK
jgi:hypothetical protein